MGDYDGDGLLDFASTAGGLNGKNGRIYYGGGAVPNLLTSVTDQRGGVTAVAYKPSTGEGNNNNRVPYVSQLVATITLDNGRGQTRTTSFAYVNNKYDYENRKPLGFQTVTAYLPAIEGESEGPQVVTTYLNDHFAQKGRIKSQTRIQGGVTYSQLINDWSAVDAAKNGPYRTYMTRTRTKTRHGSELIETGKLFGWMDWGSPYRITDYGFMSGWTDLDPSDTVSTYFSLRPDLDRFITQTPVQKLVMQSAAHTNDKEKWLSMEQYLFDGSTGIFDPTTSTNMVERRVWELADPDSIYRDTTEKFTYDAYGNLTKYTNPRGHSATYTYDSAKHLFRETETNARGHTVTTAWDMGCQAPETVTDANGLVTSYAYDVHCRETRVDLPGGNYQSTAYLSFGNPNWQRIIKTTRSPSSVAGQASRLSVEFFDGFGQAWKEAATGATTANEDKIVTLRSYDARGNLAWESIPLAWANPQDEASVAADQKRSVTYDPLGRPVETTKANGHRTTAAYTFETLSSVKHPQVISTDHDCTLGMGQNLCHVVKRTSDARGNVIRQQMTDSEISDYGTTQGSRLTEYRYDLLNRLTGVTDPGGAVWTYTHDIHGNRLSADDPGLGYWTMEYDLNGNLTRQVDAKGQVIAFTYDSLDRVTEKAVTWTPEGGSARTDTTTMTYDAATGWRPTTGKNIGLLTAVQNAAEQTHYRYNQVGQPYWEMHDVPGAGQYEVYRAYHQSGELQRTELPAGTGQGRAATPDYEYDAAGRVTKFGSYITNVSYNLRGQPERVDFGSGTYTSNAYGVENGWLDETRVFSAAHAEIDMRHYVRSQGGRVIRQNAGHSASRLNYCYDYAGRLLAAADLDKAGLTCATVGSWQGAEARDQFFSYRPDGSMASNDHIGSYSYAGSPVPHAPASVAGEVFAYDANGNMTDGFDGKVMSYDGENRPLTVSNDGNTTEYVYAADGSRLKRIDTVDGQTTTTLYVGGVEIVNPGAADEEVHWYPHENVRLSYANGAFKEVKYLHRDQLGSVFLMTDADGNRDTRRDFAPFGDELETVDDAAMASYPAKEDIGYIGEREDEAAGLMYLNARYYDPELASFIPADTALEPANTNAAPAPAEAAAQ